MKATIKTAHVCPDVHKRACNTTMNNLILPHSLTSNSIDQTAGMMFQSMHSHDKEEGFCSKQSLMDKLITVHFVSGELLRLFEQPDSTRGADGKHRGGFQTL